MWFENKMMRTFRCRLQQKPGELGKLLETIGDAKGFLGEIKTIHMGRGTVIRDLVVFADNAEHMEKLIAAVDGCTHAELLEVRDEVLEMHQGGKIAVRSRYRIDPERAVALLGLAEERVQGDVSICSQKRFERPGPIATVIPIKVGAGNLESRNLAHIHGI